MKCEGCFSDALRGKLSLEVSNYRNKNQLKLLIGTQKSESSLCTFRSFSRGLHYFVLLEASKHSFRCAGEDKQNIDPSVNELLKQNL